MTSEPSDTQREWAADKREFVAGSRDEIADERDLTADAREAVAGARDAIADARESQLNAWQERLAARAAELGLVSRETTDTPNQTRQGEARAHADEERGEAALERDQEKVARATIAEERQAEGQAALLAAVFAGLAEHLYEARTNDEVLTRIAEAAVTVVSGSAMASVTLRDDHAYRTVAATDETATAVDQAQYEVGEGPSLDALGAALVDAPSFPDQRWPNLASGPAAHGVGSSLSYRFRTPGQAGAEAGTASLNIYGAGPEAFDDAAHEVGFILAAHASLAARAVGERITLEGLGRKLEEALLSRDVIGQAKGILMERLKITPDEAFDILKRASQQMNIKLREVASQLTETGEVPHRPERA